MTDPMARLRAADPLRQAGAPSLDRLRERLAAELPAGATASRSRRRPQRRWVVPTLVGALASSGIAVAALGLLGGQERVGPVALARAALSGRNELVHVVVTVRFSDQILSPGGRTIVTGPSTREVWSTSDPPRWRIAFSYPGGGDFVGDAHGRLVGPAQVAYGAGTESTYVQRRNTLEIVSGFPSSGPVTRVPGGSLGDDPIATLRGMLAAGQLRDGGAATVGRRKVRRLVGQRRQVISGQGVVTPIEYDVDPRTYAPVAAAIGLPYVPTAGHPGHRLQLLLRFDGFETVPLSATTARLLEIQPRGRPKVSRRTIAHSHPSSVVARHR